MSLLRSAEAWLPRLRRLICAFAVAGAAVFGGGFPFRAEGVEYLIDVWDTEKGLPNSSVTAIAQTPDGYLWVGTYNGLARFDGVRFTTFNAPELGHARTQDLFVDNNGTLWINTYRGGLTSYRNGVFRREWPERGEFDSHTILAASSSNEVVFVTQAGEVLRRQGAAADRNAAWSRVTPPGGARLLYGCADGQGTLWFMTREGRLMKETGGEFKEVAESCGLAGRVLALAADAKGKVWTGTDREVAVWEGGEFRPLNDTNSEPALDAQFVLPTRDGGLWVLADGRLRKRMGRQWAGEAKEWRGLLGRASGRAMGMHEDREGGVWFNHYGNGLFHVTPDGQFQRFTTDEGLPGDRVWAWFEDAEGNLWVGVERGGLVRLREKRFQVIGPGEGLPARAAQSVCEDESGAMWFGTAGGGLCRWKSGGLESFPVGTDASGNFVFSVFPSRAQGLWLSAAAGEDLFIFKGGQVRRAPWQVHGIKAILEDRGGRVWMGTKSGLSWYTPERRGSFGARDGLTVSAVRALAEGANGSIWCGNDEGSLYRCQAERLTAFRPADALADQPIWSLLADAEGTVWAGTFQGGLLRFKEGSFKRVTTEQGLPSDVICEILEDGKGQLWLGTYQGICRVNKRGLNACLDGAARRVDCVTYGRLDGLPTLECGGNYQPACWRARDGRLWFATVKGMVSAKPEELKINPVPPPVVIEEFRVDGQRLALDGSRLVVPPGRKQFEFRFTALSFVASDKVRFRYRLEGLNPEWLEADTRNVAQYSTLPARDYRFRVLACNSDGQWNQQGSVVAFTVLPHFYETWWFLGMAGIGLVGGVAASVRTVTTRKYRQELARLEQQHAIERDRARIAKDIHDDLGAGLTQITLLSELAKREPADLAGTHLDRISDSARKMTRAMDEIVWAVDPQHDTLNGLMDYISAYTEDFLRTAGIRCRMDLPPEMPALRVDAESRYNLFLALKEALNNVVKHARASELWLRLRLEPNYLTLLVEDNGQGFPAAGNASHGNRLVSGHGLANLEKRLADIGGRCVVTSAPGHGTRVEMTVELEPGASPVVATGGAVGSGSLSEMSDK
ncbi:MAG TPA: two-component regulator propeller domain-containing protein [Candidatus Binatia bacterium]|jgi:ligand-binding sensor domain-containing protein/signal transduction histidine kinase|nr:two-component regulator propeller domain-containing protein [Candidatus Binatia bacterium]